MILTIILIAIAVVILALAVRSLRAQRLKERYVLVMLLTGLPFLLLAIWPDGVGFVAGELGIEYQTVIILCTTSFFLLSIFKLLSLVNVQDRRITTLAQQVAILMQREHMAARAPATKVSSDGADVDLP
jgi:hypothetical protein